MDEQVRVSSLDFLEQFLEPVAVYNRQGVCLFKSTQFRAELRETETAEEHFDLISRSTSHLYPYWQQAVEEGFSEFIEPGLFCHLTASARLDRVILKIQKCPLRLIVESINYAAAIINQHRHLICCNQQFLDLLGIDASFSSPFDLNQLVYSEDQEVDQLLWVELVEGKTSEYQVEKRFRGQKLIWTNFHIKSIAPEEVPHSDLYYTIILEDISEMKATYETLMIDHRRWQLFLANPLNLFFQTDLDGKLYLASQAVRSVLGLHEGIPAGTFIFDLIHPREQAHFKRFFRLWSHPESTAVMVECCFRNRSQEEVYLLIQGQRLTGHLQASSIVFYAVDITDRKQLEQELQAKEEQYRSLVSNLPGAVYRSSQLPFSYYYRFEVVSPEIAAITGYSIDALVQNRDLYRSLIIEGDRHLVQQKIKRAIALKESFTMEYQIRNASGKLRWIQDRARCVVDSNGMFQWFDGVLFDITVQKESEDLLRAIFEQAPVGINLIDLDGRIVRVNQRQCEMLGYSESEMLGMTAAALTQPAERAAEQQILQRLINGEVERYSTDKQDVGKDGRLLWVNMTISALRERGNLKYLVTVAQDISQRKQAEIERIKAQKALQTSEQQLRTLFEQAPVGISITNCQGYVVRSNAAMQGFLGYGDAELSGLRFEDYTHPDDVQTDREQFEALISGQILQYQMEKRYIRKDGTVVWGNLRVVADRSSPQAEPLIFAFLEDLVERKQQEFTLREGAQFRAIFEAAPIGIAALTPEGKFLRINAAYQNIVGYSLEQLTDLSVQKLICTEDLEHNLIYYNQLLQGEIDSYAIERRIVRSDGSMFWAHLTVARTRYPNGQLQFVYELVQDIDEIKRAQQSSERLLRLLQGTLDLYADGILVLDLEWQLMYHNEKFLQMWGLSATVTRQQDDRLLVAEMQKRLMHPDKFLAQVEREYATPTLRDEQIWQLISGKRYQRISTPQMLEGQIIGRVVCYREVDFS